MTIGGKKTMWALTLVGALALSAYEAMNVIKSVTKSIQEQLGYE